MTKGSIEGSELNPAHTHPLSLSALVASTLQEPRENRAEMWASSSSLLYDIALSLEREWTEISRIIIHEKKKGMGCQFQIELGQLMYTGLLVRRCHIAVFYPKLFA